MSNLVMELEETNIFTYSLFHRIEKQLNLMSISIAPESQTAKTFKRTGAWEQIAEAAEADFRLYHDSVYLEIAELAIAAENAWWRCSAFNRRARKPIATNQPKKFSSNH